LLGVKTRTALERAKDCARMRETHLLDGHERIARRLGLGVAEAILTTAYARKGDRARAMLAGFQSHLAEPIDPDELLVVVATLAGRTSD
jgi:CheY-like chemotaxis protein